jgi:hypothetical protein
MLLENKFALVDDLIVLPFVEDSLLWPLSPPTRLPYSFGSRDKVYVLLGLANGEMVFVREPSYSITLDEMFQSMAESITRKSERRDILFLGTKKLRRKTSKLGAGLVGHASSSQKTIDYIYCLSTLASQAITISGTKEPLLRGSTLTARGMRIDATNGLTSG